MTRRWFTRLANKQEPTADNELAFAQLDRSYFHDVPVTPTAQIPGGAALLDWARGLVGGMGSPEQMLDAAILHGRNLIVVSSDEVWARATITQVAGEAGATVVSIEAADVPKLDEATLASLDGPCILLAEFGAWGHEADGDADAAAALGRIMALFTERDLHLPVFVVTVVPAVSEMSHLLRDVGGFDRYLLVPPRSDEEWGRYLLARLEQQADASLRGAAALAGGMFSRRFETERLRDLAMLRLSRLAESKRRVSFGDVVELCMRGLVEGAPTLAPSERVRVAAHETGHVLVAMLEADGTTVPEYASIVPSVQYSGVMSPAAELLVSDDLATTYGELLRQTRVGLAGRAAEELLYGPAGVGPGCEGDLERVTLTADRAFSRWGFGPGMDDPVRSGANLALLEDDPDKRTPAARARLERMTRTFLQEQYAATLALLAAHRPLFDELRAELERHGVLGREAFIRSAQRHGLAVAASVRRAA
jgi:hypothetical protein